MLYPQPRDFISPQIPKLLPHTPSYIDYWTEQKQRCIEGYWAGSTWMPGKLYFYVNFATIRLNKPNSKVKHFGRPHLRDIEWEFFRLWEEARGFSGFELDDQYSCLRLLAPLQEAGIDTPDDLILRFYPNAINKNSGKLKKYVPARDYLRQAFAVSMGKPIYENESRNLFMLGGRGFGKSFMTAAIVAHEFLFDGKTVYDSEVTASEAVVGAGEAKYSAETLDKVKIMLDMLPGGITMASKSYPSPFSKKYQGSFAPGRQITASYKKKVNGQWEILGSRSNIKHRSFKDNEFAANGTRPGVMVFEEVGIFNNLEQSYAASVDCQRDGGVKFGSMLFLGTGGSIEQGSAAAKKMFYNPEAYDCVAIPDTWEFTGNIGYFVPAYMNESQYRNESGFIDEVKARKRVEQRRLLLKEESSTVLQKEMINNPILPSEMFLRNKGSVFPVAELTARLAQLETDPSYSLIPKKVELYFSSESPQTGGVDYNIDVNNKLTSIDTFPHTESSSKEGCVVIYEFPQVIGDKVPPDAYIIGHDPYASDSEFGKSLASIYVLKTKKYFSTIGHSEVVASYVGRPYEGRKVVNEILYKLSLFYGGAKIYFENAVGNVKEYFEKIGRLDLLAFQPQTILSKKASYSSSAPLIYGYPMSNGTIKREVISYVRDFLIQEHSRDSSGNIIRNLDRIWDKGLLQELIAFNFDGNFDRVMGFAGTIIGLNETHNEFSNSEAKEQSIDQLTKWLSNTKLFKHSLQQQTFF